MPPLGVWGPGAGGRRRVAVTMLQPRSLEFEIEPWPYWNASVAARMAQLGISLWV